MAIVNVSVLAAGYGLAELVVATTIVRVLTYWAYRANAYRVSPGPRLRLRSFSVARLKEVTSFSVDMLLIDWANKVNYAVDAVVIGVFLSTGAVALWSVSQRLAERLNADESVERRPAAERRGQRYGQPIGWSAEDLLVCNAVLARRRSCRCRSR